MTDAPRTNEDREYLQRHNLTVAAVRASLAVGKCPLCGDKWDETCWAYDGPHCGFAEGEGE